MHSLLDKHDELCQDIYFSYGVCSLYDYDEFKRRYERDLTKMIIHESEIKEEIEDCKNEMNSMIGNADKAQYQQLKKHIKELEKELRKLHCGHRREDDEEDFF